MARNLLTAGYPVTGYDPDANRMEAFTRAGGRAAASVEAVGRAGEVVFLSLPTGDVVRRIVMGEEGLVSVMPSGSLCAGRGITFLDAPVSGGEQGAIDASLSIMVGGEAGGFDRCQPLLATMGKSVVHMGGSGLGQATKLINNMIVAAGFAAVCEAWGLAAKVGLDPARLHQAIRGGWAGSRVMEETVPRLLARNFVPGGTVDIMTKDVGYALNMARSLDVPVPVTALAHELFRMVKAQGQGSKAQPILISLWEQWTGVQAGGPAA
jgi:2-hydroxy-3-oxopropionate reductase